MFFIAYQNKSPVGKQILCNSSGAFFVWQKSEPFPYLENGSDFSGLVPVTGLEPVRCCHRGILSPLRLPIPPHRHNKNIIPLAQWIVKCFLRYPQDSFLILFLMQSPFGLTDAKSSAADLVFGGSAFSICRRCPSGVLLENTVKMTQACVAEHIGKLD